MDMLATVQAWSNPPTNYIGTFLFLAYIDSALFLIFSTIRGLYRKAIKCDFDNLDDATTSRLTGLIPPTYICFGLLAWNMLSFLWGSYQIWSPADFDSLDEPKRGGIGLWMLQSTIFTDFARELVSSGGDWSAVWTIGALLYTGTISAWMAVQGDQYHHLK
jgi:hypothetical protein